MVQAIPWHRESPGAFKEHSEAVISALVAFMANSEKLGDGPRLHKRMAHIARLLMAEHHLLQSVLNGSATMPRMEHVEDVVLVLSVLHNDLEDMLQGPAGSLFGHGTQYEATSITLFNQRILHARLSCALQPGLTAYQPLAAVPLCCRSPSNPSRSTDASAFKEGEPPLRGEETEAHCKTTALAGLQAEVGKPAGASTDPGVGRTEATALRRGRNGEGDPEGERPSKAVFVTGQTVTGQNEGSDDAPDSRNESVPAAIMRLAIVEALSAAAQRGLAKAVTLGASKLHSARWDRAQVAELMTVAANIGVVRHKAMELYRAMEEETKAAAAKRGAASTVTTARACTVPVDIKMTS